MAGGCASPRRCCRAGRGGPAAWMPCCRSSICAGSRPAISRKRSRPFSARTRPNLSAASIARLKAEWEAEYVRWQRRDLSARRYVYIWVDGVYLQARMEPQAECMLVVIGATPEGKKELLGFQVGVRESAQSWRELLIELKARGLAIAPEFATGDGALGFWKALEEVFPTTRHQRCTVHKTANVLDKLPTSVQPAAKRDLRQIWTAPDRQSADAAIMLFAEKYGAKYERAVTCLVKDRDALLTFYDFPAEHWDHLRTANPDRERVRHGPAPDGAHQRRTLTGHGSAHGLQADHGGSQDLAPAEGRKPVAEGRCRCHLPQRRRGDRRATTKRRLNAPSPSFAHSSCDSLARRSAVLFTTAQVKFGYVSMSSAKICKLGRGEGALTIRSLGLVGVR